MQRFDVVCLQHEYGIFGGEAGRNITELLSRLEMPVVTTLHTVLAKPTPAQRDVMRQIIDASTKMIVMAEKGRELLRSVHDVPARKIEVIPHGIPEFPFLETHHAKAKLGFVGKTIILTFGLLSPSKGIETVIDAMPEIIKSCPNAVYVILGATHPNLVRHQGEAYRDSLTARVQRARHRGPCRLFQSVRRPDDAAGFHFDVRRLCDALSQRIADDIGHARLQLRSGKGRRIDALLARQGIAGRRTRHSGSIWRCQGDRQRDFRPADERCPPSCHAQACVCREPIDDMGANGKALSCGL